MKSRYLLFTFLWMTAACAPFGNSSDLEQRVDEQDYRLRQLQPQQADTWNEVQSMRQEIAQLKGQIAAMNRGVSSSQPEGESPLRQADAGQPQAVIPSASQDHAYEPVTGITPSPRNAPDSSAYRPSIVQNQPDSGNYGLPPDAAPQQVQAPTEATWGQPDPVPASQPQPAQKDISLALFDAGVNAYNARNYQEAERSFKDFLKNYPNHTQTAEAQYYVAETQFQRNRFPEAALAYDTVIKKYPKSPSAPGAYYKQGIAFSKMGQRDAARARMQEVISKFPNSAEAGRAKAFLKTNK